MTNHTPLNPQQHKNLRIRSERSAEMGDSNMCCVTFPAEFRRLQNIYPIVFQRSPDRDDFRSLALTGFENGENLFLNDGKWEARYVPLAMDIQPFLVGMPREGDGEKQVHIDLDSPRISDDDGTRIFDEDGDATDLLDDISTKLATLHEGYQGNSDFTAHLQRYGLIEPFAVEIGLDDGSKNRLVGFHTINQEKLQNLNGAALEELNAAGYLMPIYMALASLSNLTNLIDRKNAQTLNG